MKKVQLSQATWLVFNGKTYGPGDMVDVDDTVADSLIAAGSAIIVLKEVKGNADKAGSNSSKT